MTRVLPTACRSNVTINTTVDGGTFDIPLTPAQTLPGTDLHARSHEPTAGNTHRSTTLTTDFKPILTIDEIGEGGAIDITDTADANITGTTLGVEQGRSVSVTVTGSTSGVVLSDTAQIGTDGTWSLPVPPAVIEGLTAGETLTFDADVTNDAGRPGSAQETGVDAYLPASILSRIPKRRARP